MIKLPTLSLLSLTSTTIFLLINTEISPDWIDYTSTKDKSDSAPIPSALWDRQIQASFPSLPHILNLATILRVLYLRYYRRLITKSFFTFLQRNYTPQLTSFLLGNHSLDKGGFNEFSLSLQASKDIIKKAAKSA